MIAWCGCHCTCHEDEDLDWWPGPCAGCCEPHDACDCGDVLYDTLAELIERGQATEQQRRLYAELRDLRS